MARNTVVLAGDFLRKQGQASEAITPGHLVEFGGAKELRKHATAGGPARKAFALENDLVGKGIDDAYAVGDLVQYGVFQPGSEVYALLGASQTIAKGDMLVSNGDGALRKLTTEVQQDSLVGWALEAVTTGAAETKRIKIEVA
jgi:hypothetical protein